MSEAKQDEAKVFLQGFLDQLAQSDQTNRELVRLQSIAVAQNNAIIQALSTVSGQLMKLDAQMDVVAQSNNYLYDQMGRLGQILVSDGYELPVPFQSPAASLARGIGRDFVAGVFNSFSPGRGGGGSPRRR